MAAASSTRSVVMKATPAAVIAAIADFAAYPAWARSITRADVLASGADGRAERVRFRMDAGVVSDTYELVYEWDPDGRSVRWRLAEPSAMMAAQEGSYEVSPNDSGSTVTYSLAVDLRIPLPGLLRRRAEQAVMDTALDDLRARVEGR